MLVLRLGEVERGAMILMVSLEGGRVVDGYFFRCGCDG